MYKTLTEIKPDYRNSDTQQKDLIQYVMKEFFNNANKSSILKALYNKKVPPEMYAAYLQCAKLNEADLKKTLANKAGTFKNDYSKAAYVFANLKNHISIKPTKAEPPKQNFVETQKEAHSQNGDMHAKSKPNLFESDPEPDKIHEAWLKLSEEERRRNWERGIAANEERKKARLAQLTLDEMY